MAGAVKQRHSLTHMTSALKSSMTATSSESRSVLNRKLSMVARANKASEEDVMAKEFDRLRLKTRHKIIIGASRSMKKIKAESIHLIVTSPPYFNAKSYSQWKRLQDYLDDMRQVFAECYRVLCPGRKFCLNISDLPEKGDSGVRWQPLGPEILMAATSLGFEIVDRVFWFKTPLKGFQYGSLPFPPSPLINDSVEYIYILRKPGKSDYSYVPNSLKRASRIKRDAYVEFTKQIWSMRRVQLKNNIDGHIAPFPDDLPSRCIKLYSFVGDTILDPFGGRGTTTKMAILNKRNSILYEMNKKHLVHIKRYLLPEQNSLYNNNAKIEFGD